MAEDNKNTPKNLEELSQEELIKLVQEKEAELNTSNELNEELNEALKASESKPSGKLPTFKVGKETYELISPKSKYKGQEITAKVLEEDAELLKELVKIKAGILRLVKKGGDK